MDAALVKSEINAGGRRIVGVGGGPLDGGDGAIKCIKRRRRAPAITGNKELTTEQPPTSSSIKRSSRFRGVSRHRWTGRFEAHLWDKGSWNVTQRKKGKQVYLGAYDEEESAARAYDLAALKYWGPTTFTNFPVGDYEKEIQIMQTVTKEEYLASLRRKSSGFSRGVSKYRGVARHHHNGRWEARIGRVFGNKYLYLGTYSTQEEAAHAYDIAAIEYRGINAVTNFDLSTYIRWLRPGNFDTVNPLQGPQSSNGQPQAIRPTTNLLLSNENETILNRKPFAVDELVLPRKQEFIPHQISSSKSSPTALGLLLKSSMFQELVEKNVNASQEEIDRDQKTQCQLQQQGADDLYHGIFYGGIRNGQFVEGNKPISEVQESASYYERNEQGFWNGVLHLQ